MDVELDLAGYLACLAGILAIIGIFIYLIWGYHRGGRG
jgi:hypothetical protein